MVCNLEQTETQAPCVNGSNFRKWRRAMAACADETIIANCYRCGALTETHNIELPICPACSNALETKPKFIPNDVHLGLPHD
jgi:hypothetical protein